MAKAEIKKMVLNIGGKDIELTLEQAKKLHQGLDERFGEKQSNHYWYPYWRYEPGYTWCDSNNYTQVTYTADTQTLCMSVSADKGI